MTDATFKVNAIYPAIEGEGSLIGTPTIFLRLQGCSVGCKWCDSKSTWDFNGGSEYSLEKIIDSLTKIKNDTGTLRVSLTGGSPLEADGVEVLVKKIKQCGFILNIEVSGQIFNEAVAKNVDTISCDYKTPSSGVKQDGEILFKYISDYSDKLQVKAVIASKDDLDIFISFVEDSKLRYPDFKNYIITPSLEPGEKLDVDLIEHIGNTISHHPYYIRMICQQHKFIWGTEKENC